jgi:hypothetical protein
MPRDIAIFAYIIMQSLPDDKTEFASDILTYLRTDIKYRAPELRVGSVIWSNFETLIMKKHIPSPVEEWEHKIVDIYIGKTPIEQEVIDKAKQTLTNAMIIPPMNI